MKKYLRQQKNQQSVEILIYFYYPKSRSMKSKLSAVVCLFFSLTIFAHTDVVIVNPYTSYFDEAYQQNPGIPRGVLEAVAFTNTHFNQVTHQPGEEGSCVGLPKAYGVMGFISDGENYFNNNLLLVSRLSGYTQE